jgi:DNA-binding protein Fis
MVTLRITEEDRRVKEIIAQVLERQGFCMQEDARQEGVVHVMKKPSADAGGSISRSIRELENNLYDEKKGVLYKSLLEILEKPIIESVLERTEGNQLKAAKILGLNRNTIRAKIKKLGIDPDSFKV